ncbi:MAG: hypothetical protein EON59_06050 [Alphaproteobacteria bacterium]|nr:MAG: hypothetical protein EON59_06050 [Alphaproteobacteria bacterium]
MGPPDTPKIALAADATTSVDAELLVEGFDDAAPKPINPGELVAKNMAAYAARAEQETSTGPSTSVV